MLLLGSLIALPCGWLTTPAHAAFVGAYSPTNFTLVNTNADGFVYTPDNGLTLVLTGGNNGSGVSGMTDLLITAPASGAVSFQYAYATLDLPGFDDAGYLLDGVYTMLASADGGSGSVSFQVLVGHQFGFRVQTQDNVGEPASITISSFTAPGSNTVPEPAATLLTAPFLAAGYILLRKRSAQKGESPCAM